jgi:hypothetical protein
MTKRREAVDSDVRIEDISRRVEDARSRTRRKRISRGSSGLPRRLLVDSGHFQALLDAASIAEHGLPDVKRAIQQLRAVLAVQVARLLTRSRQDGV